MRIRARAVAAGTVANWIADYLVISTFLGLSDEVGDQGAFLLYCAINAAALAFVFFLVPETKGLELEDISTRLVARDCGSDCAEGGGAAGSACSEEAEADGLRLRPAGSVSSDF